VGTQLETERGLCWLRSRKGRLRSDRAVCVVGDVLTAEDDRVRAAGSVERAARDTGPATTGDVSTSAQDAGEEAAGSVAKAASNARYKAAGAEQSNRGVTWSAAYRDGYRTRPLCS
jgi:hypothetical protein